VAKHFNRITVLTSAVGEYRDYCSFDVIAERLIDLVTSLVRRNYALRRSRGKGRVKASLTQIKGSVDAQINGFLAGAESLAILELTEISNTKATLRITEQYLSTIMAWARQHRQARKVLIVLEEARPVNCIVDHIIFVGTRSTCAMSLC
jgi:hypothetical protein